jgi:hypothetical protein
MSSRLSLTACTPNSTSMTGTDEPEAPNDKIYGMTRDGKPSHSDPVSIISHWVNRNLSFIRSGISLSLAGLIIYRLRNSKHGTAYKSAKALPSYMIGRSLTGRFYTHNSSLYFCHEPILLRIIFGRTKAYEASRCIPIRLWGINPQEPRNLSLNDWGKINIVQIEGETLCGVPKIRRFDIVTKGTIQ